MRISDWSSDVCSSDLEFLKSYIKLILLILIDNNLGHDVLYCINYITNDRNSHTMSPEIREALELGFSESASTSLEGRLLRSEEHTSALQSLMRISYAVFCLKKKHKKHN